MQCCLMSILYFDIPLVQQSRFLFAWGCHPKPVILFNSLLFIVFCLVDCYAVVLKQNFCLILGLPPQTRVTFFLDKKVTKKSRLMMLLLQSTVPVSAAQSKPFRCASFPELLAKPYPQTVTLIVT